MKHPSIILPHHKQLLENSCIAWGLELILKLHEKIDLNDYPLQEGANPEQWGFGKEAFEELKKYGVLLKEDHLEWQPFSALTKSEIESKSYPVFSIPLIAIIDPFKPSLGHGHHAFVACDLNDQVTSFTWCYESDELREMKHTNAVFKMCGQIMPGCKIHVLTHKLF